MDKQKKYQLMDLILEYGSLKFQKGMAVYNDDTSFKIAAEKKQMLH